MSIACPICEHNNLSGGSMNGLIQNFMSSCTRSGGLRTTRPAKHGWNTKPVCFKPKVLWSCLQRSIMSCIWEGECFIMRWQGFDEKCCIIWCKHAQNFVFYHYILSYVKCCILLCVKCCISSLNWRPNRPVNRPNRPETGKPDFHYSFLNETWIRPNSTDFCRILPVFTKTGGTGGWRFFGVRQLREPCVWAGSNSS